MVTYFGIWSSKLRGYYIFSHSIEEDGVFIFIVKTQYSHENGKEVSGVDYNVDDPNVSSHISAGIGYLYKVWN